MNPYKRMTLPRGLLTGTAVALAAVWALYAAGPDAWPGLTGAWVQTGLLLGNLALTSRSRSTKQRLVRRLQRHVINPVVRALFAVRVNPLGLAVLETTGRRSGRPRRVPVGVARLNGSYWLVAEHGLAAAYVVNLRADPRVRLLLGRGWPVAVRRQWVEGVARALPDDDALARQRRIVGWNPLRALNALTVRVLGTDLVSVRIDVMSERATAGALESAPVWAMRGSTAGSATQLLPEPASAVAEA